jgi:hypothetical protein
MDIINTLTGNVTKNNTLVDKVLAKIGELENAKNAALAATGDNATTINTLNGQIANLTAELNTYIDNGTDVFMLIYMAGCGPCNAARPEWAKLEHSSNRGFNR